MDIAIILSLSLLVTASALFVGLRFFCKDTYRPPLSGDDWVMAAAWLLLLISAMLGLLATSKGYSQHLADLKADPRDAVHFLAASEAFAIISIAVSKASFAWTLVKSVNFTSQGRWLKWIIWGLLASIIAVTISAAIFLWVIIWDGRLVQLCITKSKKWDFVMVAAGWSALTDFAFAILPWFTIWNLRMPTAEKNFLGVCMSLGALSGIIAIVKITQMRCKFIAKDLTHDSVPLVILTFAESSIMVMAGSVPFFRIEITKIYRILRQWVFGVRSNGPEVALQPSFSSTTPLHEHGNRTTCTSPTPIPLHYLLEDDRNIIRTSEVFVRYEGNTQQVDGVGRRRETWQDPARAAFPLPRMPR
ncbi:hypothetical protein VTI74DRAFT_604 [Chaetomium olivicolor]